MAESNTDTTAATKTKPEQEEGCIFCKIANGKADDEIVYSDESYVCVVDIKPHAPHHYLVMPRAHYGSVKHLDSRHHDIVERMGDIGRQILREKNCDLNDSRLGFHWPPFHSIEHLHLHLLSPVSAMNFMSRRLTFRHNFPLVTVDWALDYLKNKAPPK